MNEPAVASYDDRNVAEASRQLGRAVDVHKVHIDLVRPADTVLHDGKARTVCPADLKRDPFMGRTLFGDSYVLGRKPVLRIALPPAPRAC